MGDYMLEQSNALPKYSRLKEYLKNIIHQGNIKYGEQIYSENQLAERFNISRHTVRQALNDLENEGYVRREQGRGTFCIYQEKLSNKKVAVLTTYISNYIFPRVIKGIEEVLSASGYTLILANTNNNKIKEALCLDNLIKQDIAGLIVEPTKSAMDNINLQYFKELQKKNIPYIFLNAYYSELDPSYIIMDDQKGEYLATKYLLQLGHRKIAGIFKSDDLQGLNRQNGFIEGLNEYGINLNPLWIGNYETEQTTSYPYQFIRSILHKDPRPTAIVCYNDQIALKVIQAVKDEGLRVPEDISIVGYDDSDQALISDIKLTTIKHPKSEMGRQAARLIIDMLEKRVEQPRQIYQPELIIRFSCQNL